MEDVMKKFICVFVVVIMAATLAFSADAASIANHLFDKQGGIDKGGKTWSVYGWIVTDAEITSVGYILDNGDLSSYKAVVTGIENDTRDADDTKKGESDAYRDLTLEDAVKNGGMSGGVGWDVLRAYRIQVVIDISGLAAGKHNVLVCIEFKDGGISEAFRDQSEFSFTKSGDGEQAIDGKGASTKYLVGTDNSDDTKIDVAGWAGSTVKTVKLGYKIDNEKTVYDEKYVKLIEIDESEKGIIDLAGKYAFRFRATFPLDEMPAGDHHIKLIMQDEDGGETAVGSAGGTDVLLLYYETEEEETTKAETEPETETETEAETNAETETEAAEQNNAKTAEAATEAITTETKNENNGGGLPVGAIIAIIAAAVIVVGVVVFVIVKKKK